MRLSVTTWNINSVRLRIDQVARFLQGAAPDVLCLQETKCPDDRFPLKELQGFGYPHIAFHGQKGYNGVAILSKFPFKTIHRRAMCERNDARYIGVTLERAGAASGFDIHNFYVPAGGDLPDRDLNVKFAHKLDFLADMHLWGGRERMKNPALLVGDLNVAPLEHDVWSHRQLLDVVSHTPIETDNLETLRQETRWIDALRVLRPQPEKLYTWWSYRSPDWAGKDKGRRLDHIWLSEDAASTLDSVHIHKETRSWDRPSDHVPVTGFLEI